MMQLQQDGDRKILWIDCECLSPEHAVRLVRFANDSEVYLDVSLNPSASSFWTRLKYAFFYVLGKQYDCGAFAEVVIPHNGTSAKQIAKFLLDDINYRDNHFPLLIKYRGAKVPVVVLDPSEFHVGRCFTILETQYTG